MALTGIDCVSFVVEDLVEARRFLDDWGLKANEGDAASHSYSCGDGTEVKVAALAAGDHPAPVEEGPTVRELIWGASDEQTVERIAEDLSRDRPVTRDADGTVRSVDDMGLSIAFRVSRRSRLAAEPYSANVPGAPARIDQRAPNYPRAIPQEISHVVFGVADLEPVERFYKERLGFRVSDRYVGRAVFLRAAPAGNHHHLFLLNSADKQTHFNHICFKVRNIHEVIGGGQYIASKGWETMAGPGRHLVSSACFWYFKTPVAGAFEYAADEDMVSESWTGQAFEASDAVFSEWRFNQPAEGKVQSPISQSRSS